MKKEFEDMPELYDITLDEMDFDDTASSQKNSGQDTSSEDAAHTPSHKKTHKKSASHKTAAHRTASHESGTHRHKKSKHKSAARRRKELISLCTHLGVLILILLIAVTAIVKLIRWNKGRDSGYDPTEINTEFDTESEDYFVPLSPEAEALQKDDGVTSILLLGNGALAKDKASSDGIGNLLEQMTGGKVYDASLDRTFLSVKNTVYQEDYQTDVFSLYWIANCIASGDYTLLRDTARSWNEDEGVQDTVAMLEGLDIQSIDVITILYDYHDYEKGRLLAGPYDDTLAATCCGCLLQSIRLLQQACPQARIIVASPYFAYIEDEYGVLQPGDSYDLGQGSLADYMIAYKNIAVAADVSFIDNYFGTITVDNYETYLGDDKEHLNSEGRRVIAERIASFIGS